MLKRFFFRGGLGNQMFQYALYKELKARGEEIIIDTSLYRSTSMHNGFELKDVFLLPDEVKDSHSLYYNHIIRFMEKFDLNRLFYHDNNELGFDSAVFTTKKRFITGYYCSEKYFEDVKDTLRDEFTFRNIDNRNLEMTDEMSSCNSVSVHIRRGDFVAWGMPITSVDYYKKAIDYILNHVNNPKFYVFSDDIDAASKFMKDLDVPFKTININRGKDSYKDMYLMSHCKHNITINSTFSWWGAWLNQNEDKIVVSLKNTPDWCCKGWVVFNG